MNADELKAAMLALPEPPTDSAPPHWDYWRHELWQLVTSGANPYTFPTWPPIYHTMLVNHWKEYIAVEFKYLVQDLQRWDSAILATGPENPKDYHGHTPYSRNFIHQAYHLVRWEEVTGNRIEDLRSIVEFGGGYGAMAVVMRRMGFDGSYAIFDSPEFSLLQQFYLANSGVTGVSFNERGEEKVDLLIACYSLSEVDKDLRDKFLINHPARSHLFLYSNQFVDFDNVAYFQNFLIGEWTHELVEHLPPESWYTFR